MNIKLNPVFISLTEKNQDYITFLKNRIASHITPDLANEMIEFALSKAEHDKALNKIKADLFNKIKPSNKPTLHLVISQAGGGKTNLTKSIKDFLKIAIHIDSDEFKKYNPLNSLIIQNAPKLYNFLTGLDAYLHRDEIYDEALSSKYDLVLEITPSTKDHYFNVDFKKLIALGYRIEAHILAVSEINSMVSMYERYEQQISENYGSPKIPEVIRARDSFEAMNHVVEELAGLDFVNINIYKRGLTKDSFPVLISNSKSDAVNIYNFTKNNDYKKSMINIKERINAIVAKKQSRKEDCTNLIKLFNTINN